MTTRDEADAPNMWLQRRARALASMNPHDGRPMPVDGLLIAGGQGKRAGGPKALKQTEAGLLWRVQVALLLAAGCDHVVAVLHPDALPASAPPGATLAAASPTAAMFSSLQLGLATLAGRADPATMPVWAEAPARTQGPRRAVLVLPVDCPMPAREVAAQLLAAAMVAGPEGWQVARPRYKDRHGHPLLLSPAFAEGLLKQEAATARLDQLIRALPRAESISVPVADAAVLANFNRDGFSQ